MDKNFKILKVDHIAFATSNINESKKIFTDILGLHSQDIELVKTEKVKVLKLLAEDKNTKIELLEPTSEDSIIKKFLVNRGDSLHHIALKVDSIYNAIDYLSAKNIKLIYKKPQIGSDNKLINFIHPKMTPGLLIELCQNQ